MRLIDVKTLELQSFNDNDIPKYAILSHTWGPDEVSYQEMTWINRIKAFSSSLSQPSPPASISSSGQDEQSAVMLASMEMLLRGSWNPGADSNGMTKEDLLKRSGYSKIVKAAKIAKRLGYFWIWIDTCCIDKSSSAELQEAINSMYRWYRQAGACIVYLSDVSRPTAENFRTLSGYAQTAILSCRWLKRGWTLQELVASNFCNFYYQDWKLMGSKSYFLKELSHATGIPTSVLEDPRAVHDVSVAERMSWASNRETTRLEDIGYCLLGLFDIQMPLLYGEGNKAFIRLQEEILRTTDDYSLFAWSATASENSTYRGLLARSPSEFRHCGSIDRETISSTFPISSTPIGLQVQLEFLPDPDDLTRVYAMIRARNSKQQRLAIQLKCFDGSMQYARVNAGSLVALDDESPGQLKTIYVRQKLSIPADFATTDFGQFYFRRRITKHSMALVRIIGVSHPALWDQETCTYRIYRSTVETIGIFSLRVESYGLIFPIAAGFNRDTCHYWCKAFSDLATNSGFDSHEWQSEDAAMRMITNGVKDPMRGAEAHHDVFVVGDLAINIDINAGLCGDSIALHVCIDGLQTSSRAHIG
jgi:hypothetical protein